MGKPEPHNGTGCVRIGEETIRAVGVNLSVIRGVTSSK